MLGGALNTEQHSGFLLYAGDPRVAGAYTHRTTMVVSAATEMADSETERMVAGSLGPDSRHEWRSAPMCTALNEDRSRNVKVRECVLLLPRGGLGRFTLLRH